MSYGGVVGAGVVLRNPDQGGRQNQSHRRGPEQSDLTTRLLDSVVWHDGLGDEVEANQRKYPGDCKTLVERWHDLFHTRRCAHKLATDDGGED